MLSHGVHPSICLRQTQDDRNIVMVSQSSHDDNQIENTFMKYYYVYIVKCSDGSYYTGITNNVERRIAEHNKGINRDCYTFNRRPVELVFSVYFIDPQQAIKLEKQIKGWTRKKKEAIIQGNWNELKILSKSKNPKYWKS